MTRDPAVTAALAAGRGVYFGVQHSCADGEVTALEWMHEGGPHPEDHKWLLCPRCLYRCRIIVEAVEGASA